jgi:hypothetical protein
MAHPSKIQNRILNAILILLITFNSVNLKAQYSPIVTGDSASWLLKHEMYDMAQTQNLWLGNTVTINSKKYHQTNIENGKKHPLMIGYFREDNATGKAWFMGINDTSENLIMDLGLAEGDSIEVKMYGHENRYAKVIAVETLNGKKTLTTNFKFGGGYINEYLTFIEGVGPNASILFQLDNTTADRINSLFGFLVCKKYTDNTLVYAWDTIHLTCGQMYQYTGEFQPDGIMVYPNPKSYCLKVSGQQKLTTEIYNTSGRCVLRTDEKEIMIDHLKPQIYLVKILKDNKVIHQARIAIESNSINERN